MQLRGLPGKITPILLSLVLVQGSYGFGFQNQSDGNKQQLETCRRLLESIGSAKQTTPFSRPLKETSERQRVVDLMNADLISFTTAASRAKVDDVLVINEKRLSDTEFASALANSPALFTVAATSSAQGISNMLGSRAGQPEIVVAIPTNAEGVENVFGVPASSNGPAVSYMAETSQQFRTLKNSHLLNYPINGRSIAENLIAKAKRETSDPFVVVVHNVRGSLKLPDGSSIRLDTLYEALGNRPAAVLSCDTINSAKTPTNSLLTNRVLDFKDIASGLAGAQARLSANHDLSLGSFLYEFARDIPTGDSSSAKTVKIVAMIVGGLIVVGLLYYWVCEDATTPTAVCPQGGKSDAKLKH
jgi:hypothetical protein